MDGEKEEREAKLTVRKTRGGGGLKTMATRRRWTATPAILLRASVVQRVGAGKTGEGEGHGRGHAPPFKGPKVRGRSHVSRRRARAAVAESKQGTRRGQGRS
jgi:hypothetical protein